MGREYEVLLLKTLGTGRKENPQTEPPRKGAQEGLGMDRSWLKAILKMCYLLYI